MPSPLGEALSEDVFEVEVLRRLRGTLSHEGTPTFHGALNGMDFADGLEARSLTDVEGG
jgi:hypothetical protein